MKKRLIFLGATALLGLCRFNAQAQQYDPPCVVEQWSNASTYNKVIDIDFSDSDMPDTWKGKTGTDCPSYSTGGYYNGILEVPVYENGQTSEHTYPLLFHNSTFANKKLLQRFCSCHGRICPPVLRRTERHTEKRLDPAGTHRLSSKTALLIPQENRHTA